MQLTQVGRLKEDRQALETGELADARIVPQPEYVRLGGPRRGAMRKASDWKEIEF